MQDFGYLPQLPVSKKNLLRHPEINPKKISLMTLNTISLRDIYNSIQYINMYIRNNIKHLSIHILGHV